MTSYEQHVSLLEFLYRKPGVNLQEIAEIPGILERLRDTFEDLRRSNTQLREHAVALQARNKELESYAHTVAHDLKDPLTVIITTTDVITRVGDLTPEELNGLIKQIKSTAFDMDSIIENLLLLAEVRKTEAPLEIVDMSRVVSNVLNHLNYLIEERQARINCPKSWPAAIGYGPWVEEVWANYLSNALKYGGQSPSIELGASPGPAGMVRFWTQDSGPGLPSNAQASLFSPFTQLRKARKAGHGLGLSIVMHIMEKLGGQAGVESELGKGSLFYFTLPACPTSPGRDRLPRPSNATPETTYSN